jgi:restriction system protein
VGAIWFRRAELLGSVSEVVGYKSGLALTREEIAEHLPDAGELWQGPDEEKLRVRSEEFEELITSLLYAVGNIKTPRVIFPTIALHHKFKRDREKREMVPQILDLFIEIFKIEQAGLSGDVDSFLLAALQRHGPAGFRVAMEFVKNIEDWIHVNPWSRVRRFDWQDTARLRDLFASESLETMYGHFLDQRFVDYLHKNFGAIGEINWRKFEGLAGEFFKREGYHVELGTGRNDGNVDARVWPSEKAAKGPPTMLIQCKREQKKVGKLVVKALWADIQDEKARSGLIVTTTSLSPGAEKVCSVRGYPIRQANRDTIQKWIRRMRTPRQGVFLGE